MSILGMILPGNNGKIYLTDVLYRVGWQATDRLALPNKIAEVVLSIPERALVDSDGNGLPLNYEGIVPVFPSPTGSPQRRGGGHQWTVTGNIPLSGIMPNTWVSLEIP